MPLSFLIRALRDVSRLNDESFAEVAESLSCCSLPELLLLCDWLGVEPKREVLLRPTLFIPFSSVLESHGRFAALAQARDLIGSSVVGAPEKQKMYVVIDSWFSEGNIRQLSETLVELFSRANVKQEFLLRAPSAEELCSVIGSKDEAEFFSCLPNLPFEYLNIKLEKCFPIRYDEAKIPLRVELELPEPRTNSTELLYQRTIKNLKTVRDWIQLGHHILGIRFINSTAATLSAVEILKKICLARFLLPENLTLETNVELLDYDGQKLGSIFGASDFGWVAVDDQTAYRLGVLHLNKLPTSEIVAREGALYLQTTGSHIESLHEQSLALGGRLIHARS